MPSLSLDGLTRDDLMGLGDAALHMGRPRLAHSFYAAGSRGASADHTRLGLATHATLASPQMLEILESIEKMDPTTAFVGAGMATWFKATPFTEDARFMALAAKHAALLPIANWHWNLQTVLWAVKQALNVEGDFVELGVFKGHTTSFIAEYVEFQTSPKTWFLYDTFDGIPDDQLDPGWASNNESVYRGPASAKFEDVRDRFAPYPNIEVIQGRVPEVLVQGSPAAIAFLHIDLNNATAEVGALDLLYDRMSPGGVIVLDDYTWAACNRQRAAEDVWFAARGVSVLPMPTGQGVVFIR